jgi:hypothetical protein
VCNEWFCLTKMLLHLVVKKLKIQPTWVETLTSGYGFSLWTLLDVSSFVLRNLIIMGQPRNHEGDWGR